MKKTVAVLLAACMTVTAVACSKDDDGDETTKNETEQEETEAEPEETIEVTEPSEDATESTEQDPEITETVEGVEPVSADMPADADEQIAAIMGAIDTWYVDNEYELYQYAITDMDNDGRLELICASIQGSGHYTYADYYEVDDTNSGIVLLEDNLGEGYDFPDIIGALVEYYDEDGVRYYLYDNHAHGGVSEQTTMYDLVSIQDNVVTVDNVCSSYELTDDEGYSITYFDAEGNEISEDDFTNTLADIYAHNVTGQNIRWEELTPDNAEDMLRDSLTLHYLPVPPAVG